MVTMPPAGIAELSRYAEMFNQRFGQFVSNVCDEAGLMLFYITDTELLRAARAYFEKYHR